MFSIVKYICITFYDCYGIIYARHLSPNFCGVSPSLQGEIPYPLPRPHLPNQMKDMVATWCKRKVNTAGDMYCIVIA
jgi:hypothetical protein